MGVPRGFFRARTLVGALVIASFLIWNYSQWTPSASRSTSDYSLGSSTQTPPDLTAAHQRFWRTFHGYLEKYGPDVNAVVEDEKAPTEGFKVKDAAPRPDFVKVASEDVTIMKEAHTGFVSAITSSPPQLQYIPGTRGVVSTAGGSYLPVLVISLRMLRRTGSTLPMEVFLADENEYEDYICDTQRPPRSKSISSSPFAMLFSSFEEILFLDADAFPLEQPEALFKGEPFRTKNMVTWPDFWASSASPLFYEITGIPTPDMNLRQSTESGEVLISKKTHTGTLLLCTYYNYWGPSHYYPLLSQGAAGEGDKETFVAAANAMNEQFYQVSESICALGHRKEGGMAGSAMAQFNPMQDYALTSKGSWRVRGDDAPAPDVFFIHANFPKFNPATVFEKHEVNPAFLDDGTYTRAWTIPEDVVGRFSAKVDIEKEFWREILWTACELEHKFVSWDNYRGICAGVKDYWHNVYESNGLPT
ncbi:hypothetical protein N7513_004592 [Penicillium frequentans]|nr:hypothetical protein N7513_004592 [Penicillium glabrum]